MVVLAGSWEGRADAILSLLQAGFEITLDGHIAEGGGNPPAILLATLDAATPPSMAAAAAAAQEIPGSPGTRTEEPKRVRRTGRARLQSWGRTSAHRIWGKWREIRFCGFRARMTTSRPLP